MLHEGWSAEFPKRKRNRKSRCEEVAQWQELKAGIDARVKRDHIIWVEIPVTALRAAGITNRRTVARFVQKYVESQTLPYTVHSEERDKNIIIAVKH